jgi:hypothetical protein
MISQAGTLLYIYRKECVEFFGIAFEKLKMNVPGKFWKCITFEKLKMNVPGKFWKCIIGWINWKYIPGKIVGRGELEWEMLKLRVKNYVEKG